MSGDKGVNHPVGSIEGQSHRADNLDKTKLYRLTALLSVETRTCSYIDADPHPADYEAEFRGGSRAFVCIEHARDLIRKAGWHLLP